MSFITLEDDSEQPDTVSGNVSIEREICFLAKIGSPAGLQQAFAKESHVQAKLKGGPGKSVRVRKISQDGKTPRFEMTTKIEIPGDKANVAASTEITDKIREGTFETFLAACEDYMVKDRYTFRSERIIVNGNDTETVVETNGLAFEVDVFIRKDRKTSEWCKIDLEIDKLREILTSKGLTIKDYDLKAHLSALPLGLSDVLILDDEDDDDKQELIKLIFDREFLLKVPTVSSLGGKEDLVDGPETPNPPAGGEGSPEDQEHTETPEPDVDGEQQPSGSDDEPDDGNDDDPEEQPSADDDQPSE